MFVTNYSHTSADDSFLWQTKHWHSNDNVLCMKDMNLLCCCHSLIQISRQLNHRLIYQNFTTKVFSAVQLKKFLQLSHFNSLFKVDLNVLILKQKIVHTIHILCIQVFSCSWFARYMRPLPLSTQSGQDKSSLTKPTSLQLTWRSAAILFAVSQQFIPLVPEEVKLMRLRTRFHYNFLATTVTYARWANTIYHDSGLSKLLQVPGTLQEEDGLLDTDSGYPDGAFISMLSKTLVDNFFLANSNVAF